MGIYLAWLAQAITFAGTSLVILILLHLVIAGGSTQAPQEETNV